MPGEETVYEEFGVPPVINAVATRTQVGGARVRDGVQENMARAEEAHVHVAELQGKASELIAEATGADAGYVSAGAASGLLLCAAACMARNNFDRMAQLPDTTGFADEIIIPKAHRLKYDIGLRASGATLVDVGHVSHHPIGGGVDKVQPWQIESAINEDTAAIAYVKRPHNVLKLETVTKIASEHDIPVIVDAASEVPPKTNLTSVIEAGADLVVYSGGKGLRGPQSTGIVAGRKDLIQSVALLHVPDGYNDNIWNPPSQLIDRDQLPAGTPATAIGRPSKVGPAEIIGLLTALEKFINQDDEAILAEWRNRADHIANQLAESPFLRVTLSDGKDKASGVPKVIVGLSDDSPLSAIELVNNLRQEDPRIWLGERRIHLNEFTISVQELQDDEADYMIERILAQF